MTAQAIDAAALAKAVSAGGTLAQLRGMDEDVLNFLQDLAASKYQQGDYRGALETYRYVCVHNHKDASLWLGFGRSAVAAGQAEMARVGYGMAFALRSSAPLCLEMMRAQVALGAHEQARSDMEWVRAYVEAEGNAEEKGELGEFVALLQGENS